MNLSDLDKKILEACSNSPMSSKELAVALSANVRTIRRHVKELHSAPHYFLMVSHFEMSGLQQEYFYKTRQDIKSLSAYRDTGVPMGCPHLYIGVNEDPVKSGVRMQYTINMECTGGLSAEGLRQTDCTECTVGTQTQGLGSEPTTSPSGVFGSLNKEMDSTPAQN